MEDQLQIINPGARAQLFHMDLYESILETTAEAAQPPRTRVLFQLYSHDADHCYKGTFTSTKQKKANELLHYMVKTTQAAPGHTVPRPSRAAALASNHSHCL